jgi:hypothetical protein
MANYHISKNKDNGNWNIQKEHGKNSSGTAKTQKKLKKLRRVMPQTLVAEN